MSSAFVICRRSPVLAPRSDAAEAATHMRAQTCALFPVARGQAYLALVIGTRAHTAATTHILRSVRRLSLAPA